VVIAQKNPMPTLIPKRPLSAAAESGPPASLIVLGVAVAVVAGAVALYRPRKKK
jgi:hypothetical protein